MACSIVLHQVRSARRTPRGSRGRRRYLRLRACTRYPIVDSGPRDEQLARVMAAHKADPQQLDRVCRTTTERLQTCVR